jgi:hypothetical protein
MKAFITLVTVSLVACASPPASSVKSPKLSIPDGVWVGELNFQTLKRDGTKTEQGPADLLVAACSGHVQVWDGDHKGSYRPIGKLYAGTSAPDTHLFYFTDKDTDEPGWSEVQVYVLSELDSKTARVHWSRSVNNGDLAVDDPNRYFFNTGIAALSRSSDKCDEQLVPVSRRGPAP